jgi:hypothetical protein
MLSRDTATSFAFLSRERSRKSSTEPLMARLSHYQLSLNLLGELD